MLYFDEYKSILRNKYRFGKLKELPMVFNMNCISSSLFLLLNFALQAENNVQEMEVENPGIQGPAQNIRRQVAYSSYGTLEQIYRDGNCPEYKQRDLQLLQGWSPKFVVKFDPDSVRSLQMTLLMAKRLEKQSGSLQEASNHLGMNTRMIYGRWTNFRLHKLSRCWIKWSEVQMTQP